MVKFSLRAFMLTKAVILFLVLGVISACSVNQTRNFYEEIGGKSTISQFMKLTVNRIYADPQIGHFFKGVPKRHIHKQLTEQVCELMGGPCVYSGRDMRSSHEDMGVTEADFYILVEHLQGSIREIGLTWQQENIIIEALAPMKADIVNG